MLRLRRKIRASPPTPAPQTHPHPVRETPGSCLVESSATFEDALALQHVQLAVELQKPRCRSPDVGNAENVCTFASEVVLPDILPWMEEPNWQIGIGIKAKQVRALVQIAVHAGQREIVLNSLPPMLPRNDVLYVKWRVWFVLDAETTVFAAVSRPLANQLP